MHDICACIYDSVRVEGIVRLPNRVWLSIHRYPYLPPFGSFLLNSESSFPLENLKRSKKFEFEKTWRKRILDQIFFHLDSVLRCHFFLSRPQLSDFPPFSRRYFSPAHAMRRHVVRTVRRHDASARCVGAAL